MAFLSRFFLLSACVAALSVLGSGAARAQSPAAAAAATSPSRSAVRPLPPMTDRAMLALLDSSATTDTPPVAWIPLRGAIQRIVGDPDHPVPPAPMMYYAAAGAGDKEMIDWLKAHGGRLDAIDPAMHCTAMHMAVLDGLTTSVRLLLDAGAQARTYDARSSASAIMDAVNTDNDAIAELLLKHGADPNVRLPWTGLTPLHSAAMEGSERLASILIAFGANPNQGDAKGVRPLHMAALKNRPGMVRLLIDKGADPNLASQAGTTPLHVAQRQKFADVIAILKERGAIETADPAPKPAAAAP